MRNLEKPRRSTFFFKKDFKEDINASEPEELLNVFVYQDENF
jgi:hypothetical protein